METLNISFIFFITAFIFMVFYVFGLKKFLLKLLNREDVFINREEINKKNRLAITEYKNIKEFFGETKLAQLLILDILFTNKYGKIFSRR